MSGTGNMDLNFDQENRLTSLTGFESAQYTYDAFGNRRKAIRNGEVRKYGIDINSSMSRVLFETDNNGNVINYYVYGLGLVNRVKPNGTTHFYHYNNIGNTIAMTDQNQNVTHKYSYDPYGNILEIVEADENPFKFVGQFGVMDENNGLYFMRARYYDPIAGRFISQDPLGFNGGDWNLYAYTGNNPIMAVDPMGEYWLKTDGWLFRNTGWADNKNVLKTFKGIGIASSYILNKTGYGYIPVIINALSYLNTFITMSKGEFTTQEALMEIQSLLVDEIKHEYAGIIFDFTTLYFDKLYIGN